MVEKKQLVRLTYNRERMFREQGQEPIKIHVESWLRLKVSVKNLDLKHLKPASHGFPNVTICALHPKALWVLTAHRTRSKLHTVSSKSLPEMASVLPSSSHSTLPFIAPATGFCLYFLIMLCYLLVQFLHICYFPSLGCPSLSSCVPGFF